MRGTLWLFLGFAFLGFANPGRAEVIQELQVQGKAVSFKVARLTAVEVKVYDEKGGFIRTLQAKRSGVNEEWQLKWDGKDQNGKDVSDGKYKVVVRAGQKLNLDPEFGKDGVLTGFDNPKKVYARKGNVYLLEHPKEGWGITGGNAPELDGRVWKFDAQGKPVNSFGGINIFGCIGGQDMVVDDPGRVYIASGAWQHRVSVFDSTGKYLMALGGWEVDDERMTPMCEGLALGSEEKIYILLQPTASEMAVYNRMLPPGGLGNFLYKGKAVPGVAEIGGLSYYQNITSSPEQNIIYLVAGSRELVKISDTGKTIEVLSQRIGQENLHGGMLIGPSYDGEGCIWLVDRLQNWVYRIWDDGAAFHLVSVFSDFPLELSGVRSSAVDLRHNALYIAEDGGEIKRVKGNKRLLKFLISWEEVKELSIAKP